MASTSFHSEEDFTEQIAPDEDVMLEREGRDRRGLRRELAPLTVIDRGTRKIEEGDGIYVSAESDMPEGTTGVGEVMGNLDIERYLGDEVLIPRMTHGLTVDAEDLEIDNAQEKVNRSQQALMETFDVQADLQFLLGITDEEGNEVQPGIFQWLDDNMPSANVINAADTEYDDFRLSNDGQPSNIVQREAWGQTSGIYAEDAWDMVVWKHNVESLWNTIDDNSGVALQSQWVDMGADAAGVGSSIVNDAVKIPDQTGLRTAPDQPDTFQFDINFPTADNGDNDDVMYLVPDHGGDFFEMYEQPEPTMIQEPLRKNGGQIEYEHYWRAGQAFGFGSHQTDDGAGGNVAHDVIKIENVSTLF